MKHPDWHVRLDTFIRENLLTPFEWGKFDCCLFVADAVEAMTGTDFAAPFRGRYTTATGSARALKKYGSGDVKSTLSAAFAMCCMGFGVNGVMGVFAPELFPTYLRSTGPGVSQNIGKGVGGLMGPPLAGALVATQGYSFVLGLPIWVFLIIGLLIWTLPEVGGRSLTDPSESPSN